MKDIKGQEIELVSSIIENIPHMVFVKEADTLKFAMFNKAGEELIGIPRSAMLGKNDYDFFPKEEADFFIQKDREVLEKGVLVDIPEEIIDTKRGRRILHTKKVPIIRQDGRFKYLLGISEDITDKKASEQHLQNTLATLERTNKELEQFSYVASHDLQEPLRMLANFGQLLERQYKDKLDERGHSYIGLIVEAAKRMHHTIDALLGYARLDKNDMIREVVDLEGVLKTVMADFALTIIETNANITHDPMPCVIGNRVQLAQVFQNLLGNALKFRSERTPSIHILVERDGNNWKFTVADNGIGIKDKYFEKVFMIFQRLNPDGHYPGEGIGLAICKKIIEKHNGQIWIKSEFGKGTAVSFTVPAEN
jgi:PAS domain S-box-containing protein